MKQVDKIILLTAVILVTITISAIYLYETDPQTIENKFLTSIKHELHAPISSEFLGAKEYQLINTTITVYTWRQNNTLYEAQLDEEDNIYRSMTYHSNSTLISMTPALAQTLAEQVLITETDYPPGNPFLSEPTFRYFEYDDRGPRWDVEWGLHSGNYTFSNVGFMVSVFMDTGKTTIADNDFDEITDIPDYKQPTISLEEAKQLAVKYFSESMNYTVIESTINHGIEISSGDVFIDEPYKLYWSIVVSGTGQIDGVPTRRSPVFMVDAYTGEFLASYYISWGWDTINWESVKHSYYGSIYPQIINHTPRDYEFPLSEEEILSMLSSLSTLLRSEGNESFPIRVYDEINFADSLTWETVIMGLFDDKPVIASYWSKAYDWVKTGTVRPIDSIQSFIKLSEILDGVFIELDPLTSRVIYYFNNTGNPPANNLNITRKQAINIIENSPLVDPEDRIITQDSFVSAEPRVINPDWVSQLTYIGDFRRLYVADVNQTEPRVYWLIEYEKSPEVHGGFTGTYLVDAETGEITLILEDYPLPDLLFRADNPDKLVLGRGESISFNITVEAASTLEAQFPVSVTPNQIPNGVIAVIERDTLQLSNSKTAIFKVTLTASQEAETGTYFTTFKVRLLGRSTSAHFHLEITG